MCSSDLDGTDITYVYGPTGAPIRRGDGWRPIGFTQNSTGVVEALGGGAVGEGIGKQILNEGPYVPAVVVSGGVAFPPDRLPTDGRMMNMGPRSYYGGLSVTKRFDPIVLIGGIGASKPEPQFVLGNRYTSPVAWSFNAGGALALSPQMSMRAAFVL